MASCLGTALTHEPALMTLLRFRRFIGIDWSGARAGYGRKIAVALCETGGTAPVLVRPAGGWTRRKVADWLIETVLPAGDALIGFDFSFAPPFVDTGAYLPGLDAPSTGPAFWAWLDARCADADLGAASFLDRYRGSHFYLGAADGAKARFMRLRACERRFNAGGGGKPSSVFDAIGAAQVAKASFAGMRLLNLLHRYAMIWPFTPSAPGACIVEIYCRAFIRLAGQRGLKLRDMASLNQALAALGSLPLAPSLLSDDESDALIAAAGLRFIAGDSRYWQPEGLDAVAASEGWTFGVA